MFWMLSIAMAADLAAADLSWMSGSWIQTSGNESVEETWTAPRGGTLMGVGRTVKADKTVFHEALRIEPVQGVLTYMAHPKGAAAETPFAVTEHGSDWVVFANPTHDFPKTIRYQRVDDTLKVAVRGDGDTGFDLTLTLER